MLPGLGGWRACCQVDAAEAAKPQAFGGPAKVTNFDMCSQSSRTLYPRGIARRDGIVRPHICPSTFPPRFVWSEPRSKQTTPNPHPRKIEAGPRVLTFLICSMRAPVGSPPPPCERKASKQYFRNGCRTEFAYLIARAGFQFPSSNHHVHYIYILAPLGARGQCPGTNHRGRYSDSQAQTTSRVSPSSCTSSRTRGSRTGRRC
jgi:hypothetical protein